MKIDVKTIRELAENIEKYNLNEVALESEGVKLVLKKEKPVKVEAIQVQQPLVQQYVNNNDEIETKEEIVDCGEKECILAPMVGTFYKSSAPGNPAFIEAGMNVSVEDTLCIIEAMKLMNEIESEVSGEIVDILVQNGNMVEYGQPLFKVRRA